MSEQVGLQVDLTNLPVSAISSATALQSLFKAISADNTNPFAVQQTEALGSCFHANGPFAARLPDTLARSSSTRLNRIGAFIGWENGDTACHMSRSPGGRSASLLCWVLGNLYDEHKCGGILLNLCSKLLPPGLHNCSVKQLADVSKTLERKLACLEFGQFFRCQSERLSQCFQVTTSSVPLDLTHTPTAETMQEFLVYLHHALQDENLTLRYCGTRSAAVLMSLVLSMCPEDTRVEVGNEVIQQGQRESVMFCVESDENSSTHFFLESTVSSHSNDFQKRFIQTESSDCGCNYHLKFGWEGYLTSHLGIALCNSGAQTTQSLPLQQAIANLIASVAETFTAKHWCSSGTPNSSGDNRIAKEGLKTLMGPNYRSIITHTLGSLLVPPTEFADPHDRYEDVQREVELRVPLTLCTCQFCRLHEPWDERNYPQQRLKVSSTRAWKTCGVAQLWAEIGTIVQNGILCLLVRPQENVALRLSKPSTDKMLLYTIWKSLKNRDTCAGASDFHRGVMGLVDPTVIRPDIFSHEDGETPPVVCRSSDMATIFPNTLQYPRVTNPWTVEYLLVDGRLHYGSDRYSALICAEPKKGASRRLKRPKAENSLVSQGSLGRDTGRKKKLAGLGRHRSFQMALRSYVVQQFPVLLLRSTIYLTTKSIDVNFLDLHVGLMGLSPAIGCAHYPRSHSAEDIALLRQADDPLAYVIATSVYAPVPKSRDKTVYGVTLSNWSEEAQFLSCEAGYSALYQGDCCLACAVAQAKVEGINSIIGGTA